MISRRILGSACDRVDNHGHYGILTVTIMQMLYSSPNNDFKNTVKHPTFNMQRFTYSQEQNIYIFRNRKGIQGNNVIKVLFNRTKYQSCIQLYTTISLYNTESVPQQQNQSLTQMTQRCSKRTRYIQNIIHSFRPLGHATTSYLPDWCH